MRYQHPLCLATAHDVVNGLLANNFDEGIFFHKTTQETEIEPLLDALSSQPPLQLATGPTSSALGEK